MTFWQTVGNLLKRQCHDEITNMSIFSWKTGKQMIRARSSKLILSILKVGNREKEKDSSIFLQVKMITARIRQKIQMASNSVDNTKSSKISSISQQKHIHICKPTNIL